MSKSSSSKSSAKLMAGYGEYPSAYSNANGDDPMMRWYTQEEPWNSVAPSSTTSSADKNKKKEKKSSKDSKSSKGHHHGHKY